MQTSARTITLAGKDYVLPRLFILSELKDISYASTKPFPKETHEADRHLFETSIEIVVAALRRHAEAPTADQILCSETSIKELVVARLEILKHAELIVPKDKKGGVPGEESAAA